jgi:hypothetical protein
MKFYDFEIVIEKEPDADRLSQPAGLFQQRFDSRGNQAQHS